jgi:multiple sugar transport system substrate-binding protein/putative aldouronate transport system substrate-binding protein
MDDNGEYKKVLKMLNQAYRRGLVDPDSSTQNYNQTRAKYQAGRIAFGYWTFTADSIFQRIDLTVRSPYAVIPVNGLVINNVGYNPYGQEGNAYAIGSKAKYPDRIMEFYNWLCTPKGILYFNSHVEGVTYVMKDGKPELTEFGRDTNPEKQAPDSMGGGSWSEGIQRLNYPLTHQDDPNPLLNGYAINSNLWPSTIELNRNEWNTKWREFFKADDPLELLASRNLLAVTPGSDYSTPPRPSDIATKTNQLGQITKAAGWQMVYAASDAEFESIWKEMKAQLDDFGYQEVIAWEEQTVKDRAASIAQTLATVK